MLTLRAQFTPAASSVATASRFPRFVLALMSLMALLAAAAAAQERRDGAVSHRPGKPTVKSAGATLEMQTRMQALEAAKQSGDPAGIANASRKVAALAFRQLGLSKLEDGAAAEAVDLYRRSISFEDDAAAHVELAAAYSLSGQADEAMSQTANLLLSEAGNAQGWRAQGQLWMMKQDYAHAIESLKRSAGLKADGYTLYLLGAAFLHAKEPGKAKVTFEDLMKQGDEQTDSAKRLAFYAQAEQVALADAPLLPIYHEISYTLVKPYVKGLEITPAGILTLKDVYILNKP